MSTTKEGIIKVRFGATAPSISKQLSPQKVKYPRDLINRWQAIADAITTLHIHGILTEVATTNARRKLFERIQKGE